MNNQKVRASVRNTGLQKMHVEKDFPTVGTDSN